MMKLMDRFDAWLLSRHKKRQWEEEERAFANHWLKYAPYYEYELDPWAGGQSVLFYKVYAFVADESIDRFSAIEVGHSNAAIPWLDGQMIVIPRVELLW